MGKDIGRIYKHSQSQISNSSIKAPVSSSSEYQTSSAIKLKTTSVPFIIEKHQNNSVLCSQNTTQNDATITKNDNIQSCEIPKNRILRYQPFQHIILICNVLLPHPQVHWLLTHPRYYPWSVKNICVLWRKVNLTRPPGVINLG